MKRLPNGYGSVSKASDAKHRYKPYKAVVTTGTVLGENGKAKQLRKLLGYYKTRTEALDALTAYNADPHDLMHSGMTFREVYDAWKMTETSAGTLHKSATAYNHSSDLHDRVFSELKVQDLERVIGAYSGRAAADIKTMFCKMYHYALKYDICQVNYADRLDAVQVETKGERHPFTDEEVRELWRYINDRFACLLLIDIYSGWRPNELVNLRIEDGAMYGGSKTDAGRNRMVPVHPAIAKLCDNYSLYLQCMNVRNYQYGVAKFLERIGMKHLPYEARHTFITKAKQCGVDEYALKQMVGHKPNDITEHYTHRTLEDLKTEIEKIGY